MPHPVHPLPIYSTGLIPLQFNLSEIFKHLKGQAATQRSQPLHSAALIIGCGFFGSALPSSFKGILSPCFISNRFLTLCHFQVQLASMAIGLD
jgi:hypothetical protein